MSLFVYMSADGLIYVSIDGCERWLHRCEAADLRDQLTMVLQQEPVV